MNPIIASTLRRFWPAIAVTALITVSLLAPTAPMGASENVKFGYGNNCGVKGYGYHDHGKPCPNRPFPGQGRGNHHFDQEIPSSEDMTSSETTETSEATTGNSTKTSHGNGNSQTVTETGTSATTDQSLGKGHNGKGHGTGKHHGKFGPAISAGEE